MKLNLINQCKDNFLNALQRNSFVPDNLFRACVKQWQKTFDINEMRLGPVLNVALRNEDSGRLWDGERHSIKSGVIMLSNENPDLFWTAVKDLFNEDKEINLRVNRFLHHCDVILEEIMAKTKLINTHHQNYYAASLFLALHYPSKYCLLHYHPFESFCKTIEVMQIPIESDLERYFKICRAVYNIISKDEVFMNTYYAKLEGDIYLGPSLVIVNDMINFNAKINYHG